ncbi:TPA: ABC transporter ATP-binding protein, partial [Streptococcus suis]|nr:ABC transporter ATP-binding protein [Streptococcus suis]
SNTWIEIGGDFSQKNIVQTLVELGTVEILSASESQVTLRDLDNDRLADLVSYLIENGYRIFRVVRESETLEDIFLNLTKEA